MSVDDGDSGDGAGDLTSARVFMSYRRADDPHFVGRLHDRLCDAFGDDHVFRDIDSIPVGTNFRDAILRTLDEVDVVVAVIGPRWLPEGPPRPDDFVFLELAEALRRETPIIPVLIEQTTMPSASILPSTLSGLAEINAVPIGRDPSFRADSSRMIVVARRLAEESRARREHAAAEEAKRTEQRGLLRREVVATRARLAQLEAEATRRQIEFEQGRLSALEAQLQQVEQGGDGPAERPAAVETDTPPAAVSSDTVAAESVTRSTMPASIANPNDSAQPSDQERSTSIESDRPSRTRATETAFGGLIAAAFLVNVAALSASRTVYDVRYDELDSGWVSDVAAWLLTLAIAVPLVLYRWFAARWSVAAGVVISVVVFGVFAESAAVRYGSDFKEGGWFLAKLVAVGCMLVALWITRHARFPVRRLPPSRIVLGVAIVFSAMVALATIDDWVEAGNLVDLGSLPYRTPVIVWLLFLVAPVTVPVIVLAKRRSLNATMTLATVATTGTVGYTAQAAFIDEYFGRSGSAYVWTAVASAVCAAAAWHLLWRSRSVDGSRSGEH